MSDYTINLQELIDIIYNKLDVKIIDHEQYVTPYHVREALWKGMKEYFKISPDVIFIRDSSGEKEAITRIRQLLSHARKHLMKRGEFDGEAFEIMWCADNSVESALNMLIDLENMILVSKQLEVEDK